MYISLKANINQGMVVGLSSDFAIFQEIEIFGTSRFLSLNIADRRIKKKKNNYEISSCEFV